MTSVTGKFTTIGLGTNTPRYFWNGIELQGVVKMFIYKGVSVTLTVTDISVIPTDMRASGIKVKEKK